MMIKRLLPCIFVILLALASTALFQDAADADGSGLPESYDMRDHYDIPDVRNQGNYGTCWTFASTGSMMVTLSADGRDAVLSPLYMDQTGYDGYGYEFEPGDGDWVVISDGLYRLNDFGGYPNIILLRAMDWKTVAEEYLAPCTETLLDNRAESVVDPVYSVMEVRNYCIHDGGCIDSVKSMLMKGYAGEFGFYASLFEYEDDFIVNYYPSYSVDTSNHDALLIGWDDNYPKENFPEGCAPSSDGAWLVQNIWGTYSGYCGYNWVSYECMIDNVAFYTVVERNDGTVNLYSYDHGVSIDSDYTVNGPSSMANVFTAEGDEELTGASFASFSGLDSCYKVDAYILSPGFSNPTDGRMVFSSGWLERDWTGSSYVEFDDPVRLSAGDVFSVVVSFCGDVTSIPLDRPCDHGDYICNTVANSGESFILVHGEWMDVGADGITNARVKAYTSDVAPGPAASVGGNEYATLQEAVDGSDGAMVVVLRDVSGPTVLIGSDAGIDLNAHTFTSLDGPAFAVEGSASLSLFRGTVVSGGSDGIVFDSDGCLSLTHVRFVSDACSVRTFQGTAYMHSVWSDSGSGFDIGGSAAMESCVLDVPVSGGAVIDGGTYGGPLGDGVSVVSGTFSENPSAFLAEGSVVEPGTSYVAGKAAFVTEEGDLFTDLVEALLSSDRVTMASDCRIENYVQSYEGEDVLDLAGFTLEISSFGGTLLLYGDLTIIDSTGGEGLLVIEGPLYLYGGNLTLGAEGAPVNVVIDGGIVEYSSYGEMRMLGGSTMTSPDGVCEYAISSDGDSVELMEWRFGTLFKTVKYRDVEDGTVTETTEWGCSCRSDTEYTSLGYWLPLSDITTTVTVFDDGSADVSQKLDMRFEYGAFGLSGLASEGSATIAVEISGLICDMDPDQRVYHAAVDAMRGCMDIMASYGYDPDLVIVIRNDYRESALFTSAAVEAADSVGADLTFEFDGSYGTSYTIRSEDLPDILGMGDISVSFRPAGASELNILQRSSMFGGLAFELGFEVDGKPVDSLPVKVEIRSMEYGSVVSYFKEPVVFKAGRLGLLVPFADGVDGLDIDMDTSCAGLYIVMDKPCGIQFLLKVNHVAAVRSHVLGVIGRLL